MSKNSLRTTLYAQGVHIMGLISFIVRLPFSVLGYALNLTKNSVLIAAAIIFLGTARVRDGR